MAVGRSDWRARIGILNPNPNINLTCEWTNLLPDGVTHNEAVMGLSAVTSDMLVEMRKSAISEATKLADSNLDIILFACTSGSFVGGLGYDEAIIKELEEAVKIPATTSSTCVLTAMRDLKANKMALIGPYTKDLFDIEIKFYKDLGIDTLYSNNLNLYEINDIVEQHQKPYMYYQLAKEAYRAASDIDVIFITCMQSPALEIVNIIQQETGKPVISSCIASLYGVLKMLGIREQIKELGKLGEILGTGV